MDHLDTSSSETVRRHAETFRRARASTRGEGDDLSDELDLEDERMPPWDADGYALRVLGATGAKRVLGEAAAAGWRAVASVGRGRRGGTGAWVDAVVVRGWRRGPDGHRWFMAHYRAEPVVVPRRRVWKFVGAVSRDPDEGMRSVGARELMAKIASAPSDALECEHELSGRGGGP